MSDPVAWWEDYCGFQRGTMSEVGKERIRALYAHAKEEGRAEGMREAAELRTSPAPGTLPMPRELTAENGMKAALMGEFEIRVQQCGPNGREYTQTYPVDWNTIKKIYRKAVEVYEGQCNTPSPNERNSNG